MQGLERSQVTTRLVMILTWNQVRLLVQTPETIEEWVAHDLLLGHGWRQVEVRRTLAVDVAEISTR